MQYRTLYRKFPSPPNFPLFALYYCWVTERWPLGAAEPNGKAKSWGGKSGQPNIWDLLKGRDAGFCCKTETSGQIRATVTNRVTSGETAKFMGAQS